MEQNLIIVRSVYGKVNQSYILNPCVDPSTNTYADCVRSVDKNGDMILSEKRVYVNDQGSYLRDIIFCYIK
jgi:hypothetical protein